MVILLTAINLCRQFFREHRRNSEQADIMPQFTKLGYKKMKMPEGLHQVSEATIRHSSKRFSDSFFRPGFFGLDIKVV